MIGSLKIGTRLAVMAGAMGVALLFVGGTAWWALKADESQFEASALKAQQFEAAVDLARHAQVTFKIQI